MQAILKTIDRHGKVTEQENLKLVYCKYDLPPVIEIYVTNSTETGDKSFTSILINVAELKKLLR